MSRRLSKQEQAERQAITVRRKRRAGWVALIAVLGALLLVEAVARGLPGRLLPDSRAEQAIWDPDAPLAPFYTSGVLRWEPEIRRWAGEYGVNPNVIAIVIQIESCGNPAVLSAAGATGLMQVMPFHFDDGENMLNPDTNVRRGMSVFYECLSQFAGWDLGLALACYNGGPSVTQNGYDTWAPETQYYYRWATGLWNDVVAGRQTSQTLEDWLAAGGSLLCARAGLTPPPTVLEPSARP